MCAGEVPRSGDKSLLNSFHAVPTENRNGCVQSAEKFTAKLVPGLWALSCGKPPYATVPSESTTGSALPELTEDNSSWIKLRCSNNMAYEIHLKPNTRSKGKEMKHVNTLGAGCEWVQGPCYLIPGLGSAPTSASFSAMSPLSNDVAATRAKLCVSLARPWSPGMRSNTIAAISVRACLRWD